MSDDLESKIKQIADLFKNKDEMPDGLKSIVDMVKGKPDTEASSHGNKLPDTVEDDAVEVMLKLKRIMDSKKVYDDPKIRLLNSIKPFLRESRQEKVNNCIKVLSLSKMTRYMEMLDKNG